MPDLKTVRFTAELGPDGIRFRSDGTGTSGEYVPADLANAIWRALTLAEKHFGHEQWADPADLVAAKFLRETVATLRDSPVVKPETAGIGGGR